MAVMKYCKNKEWVDVSRSTKNRLRFDKNLSDVKSTDDARKNLGLTGDVQTHNHDTRYMTAINNETGLRQQEDTKLSNSLKQTTKTLTTAITTNKTNGQNEIKRLEQNIASGDQAERTWAKEKIDNLRTDLNTEISTRTSDVSSLRSDLTAEIKARSDADQTEHTFAENIKSSLTSQVNSLDTYIKKETAALNESNTSLNKKVSDLQTSYNAKVSDETKNRITADNELRNLISSNVTSLGELGTKVVYRDNGNANSMTFHWSEKDGLPKYIWGGDIATDSYIYNPLKFHVSLADKATNADYIRHGISGDNYDVIKITGIAGSDSFRLRLAGTNDNGSAELATADNGNEPIYVRQYTGDFKTISHSATLLDSSGNTSFPGTVTAPHLHLTNSMSMAQKTWNPVGDDAAMGSIGEKGTLGIKGVNGHTALSLVYRDGNLSNKATMSYSGGNLVFNKPLQSSLAGNAATATKASGIIDKENAANTIQLHWKGKSGQPSWLWGGNSVGESYVYNPQNFSVNYAKSAGTAATASRLSFNTNGSCGVQAGGKDNGDAIDNSGSNMTISSWWGIGFYDSCNNKYTLSMDVRAGNFKARGDIRAAHTYNAVFNDYAEFFEKGEEIEPGDIVALDLNSDKEQYVKATERSLVIVGVCTDEYAHIIGGKDQEIEENKKEFAPISLMGRVHVKVQGDIHIGDKITASDVPGVGRKAKRGEHSIGTALTDIKDGKVRVLINL